MDHGNGRAFGWKDSCGQGRGPQAWRETGAWKEEIVEAFADGGGLLILAFTVLPVFYMLPTLIGAIRRVDGLALVRLVNLRMVFLVPG